MHVEELVEDSAIVYEEMPTNVEYIPNLEREAPPPTKEVKTIQQLLSEARSYKIPRELLILIGLGIGLDGQFNNFWCCLQLARLGVIGIIVMIVLYIICIILLFGGF